MFSTSFLSDHGVFVPSDKCAENTAFARRIKKKQNSSVISKEKVNSQKCHLSRFSWFPCLSWFPRNTGICCILRKLGFAHFHLVLCWVRAASGPLPDNISFPLKVGLR